MLLPLLLPLLLQAVGSRSNVQCLEKWYSQLSPSMVARGEWGSGDDRRLLRSLFLRCGGLWAVAGAERGQLTACC